MLKSLNIQNYALIDSLELTWHPGMSAMTGETGSGKSIVSVPWDCSWGVERHLEHPYRNGPVHR